MVYWAVQLFGGLLAGIATAAYHGIGGIATSNLEPNGLFARIERERESNATDIVVLLAPANAVPSTTGLEPSNTAGNKNNIGVLALFSFLNDGNMIPCSYR